MADYIKVFKTGKTEQDKDELIMGALECLDVFGEHFNSSNIKGMDECCHFPHYLLSGNELICWEKSGQLPKTFFEDLKNQGWSTTVTHYREVILVSLYWQEVLKAVEFGGFDCLGHIDFPKRYYGELVYDEAIMNEIFNRMKKSNIVIEINTSSLRKGLATSLPDLDLLRLYKNNAGIYVTIGSDAHNVEDLGADNYYAKDLIKQTLLSEVVFKQHKPFLIGE